MFIESLRAFRRAGFLGTVKVDWWRSLVGIVPLDAVDAPKFYPLGPKNVPRGPLGEQNRGPKGTLEATGAPRAARRGAGGPQVYVRQHFWRPGGAPGGPRGPCRDPRGARQVAKGGSKSSRRSRGTPFLPPRPPIENHLFYCINRYIWARGGVPGGAK